MFKTPYRCKCYQYGVFLLLKSSCAQMLPTLLLTMWVSEKIVGFIRFLLWLTLSVDK
jgi:hypothetical protein